MYKLKKERGMENIEKRKIPFSEIDELAQVQKSVVTRMKKFLWID